MTASAEDPSIIGVSLMVAEGLAASQQLEEEEKERQGDGSKAITSPDDSQPGQCAHFNIQSKKGYYSNVQTRFRGSNVHTNNYAHEKIMGPLKLW